MTTMAVALDRNLFLAYYSAQLVMHIAFIWRREIRFKGVLRRSLCTRCSWTFWDWLADVNHNVFAQLLSYAQLLNELELIEIAEQSCLKVKEQLSW